VFDWPTDGRLRVPLVGNERSSAWMLEDGSRLRSRKVGSDIVIDVIDVPRVLKDDDATVVVLELPAKPIVYKAPKILAETDVFVESVLVSVGEVSEGLVVKYTVDCSDPIASSETYSGPVTMRATGVFRARAFHNGRPVSDVSERRFVLVEPLPSQKPGRRKGLSRSLYQGDWDKLPDFGALTAVEAGVCENVQLGVEPFPEYTGLRLEGTIDVGATDVYRFNLASDDGARLWIDGELVVDHDGLHSPSGRTGAVALAKGAHSLRVDYFNKTGGAALSLAVAGSGTPLVEVSPTSLRHG
jgi:hypothetical protein